MNYLHTAALTSLLLVFHVVPLTAETIRLKSGKEVQIIDGKLPEKVADEIYREADELLKKGRLHLASEYWRLILEKARGGVVFRARAAQEKIKEIEYGSFVVLRSDKVLKGRVKARLRADLLGLEGKREIPLWQVKEIVAEYHLGYSQVSKSFYPLTILEIKLRDRKLQTSRIIGEIEFVVEAADGSSNKALLGKDYELLRSDDLRRQLESLTADRVVKVVIYPDLKRHE